MNHSNTFGQNKRLPTRGWIGLLLIAFFWPLNWLLPGLRTHILFFPLWLGYILTVDGLVGKRKGTSLFTRSRMRFLGLFVVSAPAWWLFELFNSRIQNWQYLGEEYFSPIRFFVLSTISFSTVIPAVFGTAELWSTFISPIRGPVISPRRHILAPCFLMGVVMLALLLIWPHYFFPFLWLSVLFILEPINALLGFPVLLDRTGKGDWTQIASLCLGALTCGFFWEMWNFYSFPKWIYTVPFVNVIHIFEMPLLGYGGYLPFALELFALYSVITGLFGMIRSDYIQLGG